MASAVLFDTIPVEIILKEIIPYLRKRGRRQFACTNSLYRELVWAHRKKHSIIQISGNATSAMVRRIAGCCSRVALSAHQVERYARILAPHVRTLSIYDAEKLKARSLVDLGYTRLHGLFLDASSPIPWWNFAGVPRLEELNVVETGWTPEILGLLKTYNRSIRKIYWEFAPIALFGDLAMETTFPVLKEFLLPMVTYEIRTSGILKYMPQLEKVTCFRLGSITDAEDIFRLPDAKFQRILRLRDEKNRSSLVVALMHFLLRKTPTSLRVLELLNELVQKHGAALSFGDEEIYENCSGNFLLYHFLLNIAKVPLTAAQRDSIVLENYNSYAEHDDPTELFEIIKELVTKHECRLPNMSELEEFHPALSPMYTWMIKQGAIRENWLSHERHYISMCMQLNLTLDNEDSNDNDEQ